MFSVLSLFIRTKNQFSKTVNHKQTCPIMRASMQYNYFYNQSRLIHLGNIFSGRGTDEKAIIWILGHRNADQRKQIKLAYQEIYLEDRNKKLKSELSVEFEVCINSTY